jgi:hypothetical protein
MESWVPLFVAIIAGVAAVSVAFWNSRGESAELRQLKAMNEVLTGMLDSQEKETFTAARDELARRVAEWVSATPRRRRQAVGITVAVGGLALMTLAVFLAWPTFVRLGWDSMGLSVIAGVFAAVVPALIAWSEGVFRRRKRGSVE